MGEPIALTVSSPSPQTWGLIGWIALIWLVVAVVRGR